jgi:1-deoxy-D-xylulose-5-phosphate reductoisomerase
MRCLYLAGACGSIGTQTLDIVRENPSEFKVIGMSVGRNKELAVRLIEEFHPEIVCFRENYLYELSYTPKIVVGDAGLLELASYSKYEDEVFVNALVGMSGLMPTISAIKAHKTIALANKETLVAGGDIVKEYVKKYNVALVPIDSEHSAILQCLQGESHKEIKRLIITASGGSFSNKTRDELKGVTKEAALKHPNWSMGAKITFDSATMMNKGFEVIEAHHLFDVPYEQIDTILHPQSIIHSMVEYKDGTIKAELGVSNMHTPISYALRYPHHNVQESKQLDLFGLKLDFMELSKYRFPCLGYAYYAASRCGIYPAVLNAANEAAVKLFLNDKIEFLEIERIIEKEIKDDKYMEIPYTLENVVSVSLSLMKEILSRYGVD